MQSKLFNINNGILTLTEHCHTIWYLQSIIDKYGEDNAKKIFLVLHYLNDLNPTTNAFANISEVGRLEAIISAVCPELPLLVDWNDEEIVLAISLIKELYETPTYRVYKTFKTLIDKLNYELQTVNISLYKDDGNIAQVDKALSTYNNMRDGAKKAFEEFEKENNVEKVWGGAKRLNRPNGRRDNNGDELE